MSSPTKVSAGLTSGVIKIADKASATGTSGSSQVGAVVQLNSSEKIPSQYLSTGVHLGGIAANNLLDDYEEGTWTATITTGSGSVTLRSDRDLCSYTKIGNMVNVRGRVDVESVSSPSGHALISNLPFTSSNSFAELSVRSGGAMMHDSFTGLATGASVIYQTHPNTTSVNIYEQDQNNSAELGPHFQAASVLVFELSYPAA
tara:strand:+ start:248 stop:853 length:606 start_codon:yes stop_codon:yes gene_type:complete